MNAPPALRDCERVRIDSAPVIGCCCSTPLLRLGALESFPTSNSQKPINGVCTVALCHIPASFLET